MVRLVALNFFGLKHGSHESRPRPRALHFSRCDRSSYTSSKTDSNYFVLSHIMGE